eukprot:TRINITY_DN2619_c0_g1_i2.p1 TRINITY_DN2619_c0_g1~~TRINITY_DN2619_c0_g1_i2.p1  ORF type:complete len:450 (+),score=74.70 TRINITY_DN2619_c0_g1_i2:444-1793(+)
MSCVLAMERGWHPQNDLNFKVVGPFKDLRDSVNSGETAAFLWEYFTTKPYADSGEVKFIGDITTPWSCFMMAGRPSYLQENLGTIKRMLRGLRQASEFFHDSPNMYQDISENYQLSLEDAKEWYKTVNITASSGITESSLVRALEALNQIKVISNKNVNLSTLIEPMLCEIEVDIKHMKLYSKPELVKFVHNSLISLGKASGPLNYTDLLDFDQHHYNGTEALDLCMSMLNLSRGSKIINVGSGLGGPARYLAGKHGVEVLAIELQSDLNRTSAELVQRCGLSSMVINIGGDFLKVGPHLCSDGYDAIVSWLTILHIQNREKLFHLCYRNLKPGGYFFAEDFFKISKFTSEELSLLQEEVACPYVPDMNSYKNQLRKAGFECIQVTDLTSDWRDFTRDRVSKMEDNKDTLLGIHRQDTYQRLLFFYTTIRDLFAGGNLGGARFFARKPL